METKESIISNYNHSITLTERKNLLITGVKKIENFDKEEFLIETTMGFLVVKGDGLELIKLDTISGNVSIKGIVNGFTYIDDNSKLVDVGTGAGFPGLPIAISSKAEVTLLDSLNKRVNFLN